MTLCEKCATELQKGDKIVYSLEIRRQDGKYNGEFNNFLETSQDNLAVLKLLKSEINKIFNDDMTEYSIGHKGDPQRDN